MSFQKRSPVWIYFSKNNNTISCNCCKTEVKAISGNTSNLKRHLQSKHPTEFKKLKLMEDETAKPKSCESSAAESHQFTIKEAFTAKDKLSSKSPKAQALTLNIARMICLDYQPFSIVEDIGFRKLLADLEPRFNIPSRKTFSEKIIPELFKAKKASVVDKLKSEKLFSISVTTDSWTSRVTESYVALTVHYLDSKMNMISLCLAARPFNLHHTAENIKDLLEHVLSEFEIDHETVPTYVITDNARNFTKAVDALNVEGMTCFAHTIQLVIKHSLDSFRGIQQILTKVRGITGHFHRSTKAAQALAKAQQQLQIPQNKLKQDVPTRFNSSFYMLERAVSQKKAISVVLAEEETSVVNLTAYEWKVAEQLVVVLKPFEIVTELMSGEKYPTASMVIPSLAQLEDTLNRPEEDLNDLKKQLLVNIQERWPNIRDHPVYSVATFIDPRFKLVCFSDSQRDKVFENVIKLCTDNMISRNNEPITDPTEANASQSIDKKQPDSETFWSSFQQKVQNEYSSLPKGSASIRQEIQSEIHDYLKLNPIPVSNLNQVQLWWKENGKRFPGLFAISKRFLSIPATSIPSERVFSKAGIIVSTKRSQLKSSLVEELVFLHCNWDVE